MSRNDKFKTNSLASALNMVERQLAAIYIPEFVARLYGKKWFELETPNKIKKEKRSLYLVMRDESLEGSIAKKVGKALRRLVRSD